MSETDYKINNDIDLSPHATKKGVNHTTGYLLSWHNLEAYLQSDEQNIIKKCSGYIKQGEFVTIMGPSGAGKSTFMNTISGRYMSNSTIRIQGEVTLNDATLSTTDFFRISSYVQQEDRLLQTQTVSQSVEFSANMTCKGTYKEKMEKAKGVISKLGLTRCKDTYIGGKFLKGVSGGEKKRTSIASELVSDPQVIFLDEPTTGLDSYAAEVIVRQLRDLTLTGKTVVMTIHQPNSDLYALLDRLILIIDGAIVYDDKAHGVRQYFETNIGVKFPDFCNPMDFMMLLSSKSFHHNANLTKIMNIEQQVGHDVVDKLLTEGARFRNLTISHEDKTDLNLSKDLYYKPIENDLNIFEEFFYVTWRSVVSEVTLPMTFAMKIFQFVVIMAFQWLLYKDLAAEAEFNNYRGFFFMICQLTMITQIMANLMVFPEEKNIVINELSNRKYRLLDYLVSKIISVTIFTGVVMGLFAQVYFLCNVRRDFDLQNYLVFVTMCILSGLVANSYGMMIGCIFETSEVAMSLGMVSFLPWMMCMGFVKSVCEMGWWIRWLAYVNPWYYCLSVLWHNEFTPDSEVFIQNPTQTITISDFCMYEDDTQAIIIVISFWAAFYCIAYAILTYKLSKGMQ